MDHLKEFKEYDNNESMFEKFTDIIKHLKPNLKKSGDGDTISKLKDLVQHADKVKDSIFNKATSFAKDTWMATKREGKETRQAISILERMVKGEKVSDNEKKFLKAQSGDVIKAIATVGISGIPVPFPITPLLILVGKKYNFNVLPQDQQHLLDAIEPSDEDI